MRHYRTGVRPNKAVIVAPKPLTQAEREEMEDFDESDLPFRRPVTRGDCSQVPRPCPFLTCKWNNYIDIQENGNLRFNFPDLEPDEMPSDLSCTLDIIDTYDVIGAPPTIDLVGLVTGSCADSVRAAVFRSLDFMAMSTRVEKHKTYHDYVDAFQINWLGDDDDD